MTTKRNFAVPKGLDDKLFTAQFEAGIKHREERFASEFEEESELHQIKESIAAEAARAAGTVISSPSQETRKATKAIMQKLRAYRPIRADVPSKLQGLPQTPVLGTPPYAGTYSTCSMTKGAIYVPWKDTVPDANNGELGGTFELEESGVAVCESGFVVPVFSQGGINEVEITGAMHGIYCLQAPAYCGAYFEIDLVVTFISGATSPPTYSYGRQNIGFASTPILAAASEVGIISGTNTAPGFPQPGDSLLEFTKVFKFPDAAPGPLVVVAGVNMRVVATPSAFALLQADVILNTIQIF